MDEDPKINTAFAYRLLQYHKMALSYYDEKKIEGLKYLSALNYDMGRNIIKWDKSGEIIYGKEEQIILLSLSNLTEESKRPKIVNIKIPLFWALYRNRKYVSQQDNLNEEDK